MRSKKDESSLPPLATGIAVGVWVTVLLILAFIVVPLLFGSCTPPQAPV